MRKSVEMLTAETETYYAAFNAASPGPLNVYVDGSFLVRGVAASRRVPVGSGWAIEGADGSLAGYGVSVFKARHTVSSEHHELRSMVAFLDAMHESFPEFINTDRQVVLHCDNTSIVDALSSSYRSEHASRLLAERYGNDFVRILYYISVMDMSFKWVKGHAENKFNKMADRMARNGYRSMLKNGFFNGTERKKCIQDALSAFKNGKLTQVQVKNMVARLGMAALEEVPTVFVDTYHTEHRGRLVAGFSFSDASGIKKGVRCGVFMKDNEDVLFLSLRAVNHALQQIVSAGKEHQTIFIRVKHSETAELINLFAKGAKLKRRRKNAKVAGEVDKLMSLISKQHTLAMGTKEFAKIATDYNSNYGMCHAVELSRDIVSRVVADECAVS